MFGEGEWDSGVLVLVEGDKGISGDGRKQWNCLRSVVYVFNGRKNSKTVDEQRDKGKAIHVSNSRNRKLGRWKWYNTVVI